MGKRWRKKNKKQISEFGEIENDGVKGTIIPLEMTGTTDDPNISFNFNRARQSINESMDKQKQEIKDAFDQEFDKKKHQSRSRKNTRLQQHYRVGRRYIYSKKTTLEANAFMAAVIIGSASLLYTNYLVDKLDQEERKKIELWAEATYQLANSGMGPLIML